MVGVRMSHAPLALHSTQHTRWLCHSTSMCVSVDDSASITCHTSTSLQLSRGVASELLHTMHLQRTQLAPTDRRDRRTHMTAHTWRHTCVSMCLTLAVTVCALLLSYPHNNVNFSPPYLYNCLTAQLACTCAERQQQLVEEASSITLFNNFLQAWQEAALKDLHGQHAPSVTEEVVLVRGA